MAEDDFYATVASHLVEGGFSSKHDFARNEEELNYMIEGGWSGLYDVVSSRSLSELKAEFDYLLEEE